MVSHKRFDLGFNGYQLPTNARAPRSARKRRLFEKECAEDKMCAFDLLATVAGNLLLRSRSSLSFSNNSNHGDADKCLVLQNTIKNEVADEKPIKAETFCGENNYKEYPSHGDDVHCGFSSEITNPDHSSEFDPRKLINDKTGNRVEGSNSGHGDSCFVGNSDHEFKPVVDGETVILDAKPDVVVNLGSSSTELLVCGDNVPHGSRGDVNLISKDDDENFSGHFHSSWTKKPCRLVPRIGDRRIRNILASRYWKGPPKSADVKPRYCAKRNHYFRYQKKYLIKKKKYFDRISELNSDGISNSNGYSKGGGYHSRPKMHRDSGSFSSANGQRTSFVSSDSHVRLRIKSFRVPELFIEIPETATVGSLKRTVMEAVAAILGGGLRVGLMLQGKKVRDDSKTLLQTGISQDNTHSDSLGFCLEPSSSKSPNPTRLGSSPCALQRDTTQTLTRYSPICAVSHQHACDGMTECHTAANMGDLLESDHDSAPSPTESHSEKSAMDDSKALVPVVAGPLTMVDPPPPPCCKPRRAEQQQAAQRRIRRPFSVAEVEALVQAVEKLGTGRWRDVKLRAFDNANHRTYVDLKDKWKTLVHTARISPQQRRGEPVPQELLDRVLTAQAYWSEKQHTRQRQRQTQTQAEGLLLF